MCGAPVQLQHRSFELERGKQMREPIPEGAETRIGITNVLTNKIVAIYTNAQRAREERNRLDGSCGKSIYADWTYTVDELRDMGFFIPVTTKAVSE